MNGTAATSRRTPNLECVSLLALFRIAALEDSHP